MKNNGKLAMLKPALALFIICLAASVLLSVTNFVTKDKIAAGAAEKAASTRRVVYSDAAGFSEEYEIGLDGKTVSCCDALDSGGNVIGYVFTSSNKGYGGAVKTMTAVNREGTVLRIAVLELDDETPGLGQNAAKDDFTGQFAGKSGRFSFIKSGTAPSDENEINGVTSASFSSKAVIAGVNDALDAYNHIVLTPGYGQNISGETGETDNADEGGAE